MKTWSGNQDGVNKGVKGRVILCNYRRKMLYGFVGRGNTQNDKKIIWKTCTKEFLT